MKDDEHTCHCPHVVVILHDFKRIEKVAWLLIAGILGVLGKEAYGAMTDHIRSGGDVAHAGERLAPDRIGEPQR